MYLEYHMKALYSSGNLCRLIGSFIEIQRLNI